MKLNFDLVREKIFEGRLEQFQVDGLNFILATIPANWACAWAAYAFATATWETNHQMKPVVEAYWLSESWRKVHLRYYPYYGRGFVQLTWLRNYQFFARHLGVDLVDKPELALDPKIAAKIMVYGMEYGNFTGTSLANCIDSRGWNFETARRIINGMDHAQAIASIAQVYLEALSD